MKERQLAEINAELNPVITIKHNPSSDLLKGLRINATKHKEEAEYIAVFPSELRRKQG